MDINTCWPRFTHWGEQRWLKGMLLDPSGTVGLLKDMHEYFGRELYVDGLLCFNDHGVVAKAPKSNPRDREVKITPAPVHRQALI